MRFIKIPKKTRGQYREICSPNRHEKEILRTFLPALNVLCLRRCGLHVHGFMPGRSPVSNAAAHIGYQYTLSFDIADFFDSVRPEHVKEYLDENTISKCFINRSGSLRPSQGLPTSPQIANLAFIKADEEIISFLGDKGRIVYTRYADDLSFSFDDYPIYQLLKENIPNIVAKYGFVVNNKKTHLQSAKFGRRRVTGVMVDNAGLTNYNTNINGERVPTIPYLHTSRKFKRKLRAARHQNNTTSLKGLEQFSKLKLPNRAIEYTIQLYKNIKTYIKAKEKVIDKTINPIDYRLSASLPDIMIGTNRREIREKIWKVNKEIGTYGAEVKEVVELVSSVTKV